MIGFLIIGLFLFVLICASFYFYHTAVARGKKHFIADDPDLQIDPEIGIRSDQDKQWWKNQSFYHWKMGSRDKLRLFAYYLPAKKPTKNTVILAHGYSGDAFIMSEFARLYHDKYNMNILLPDARGHGKSEGHYIGFGWHERLDCLDWIQQVLTQLGADSTVLLHGVSMGAATVMMTSGEELPSQVKAIVADCGYTSAKDELSYQLKRMYHLPAFPILTLTSGLTKLRAGYTFSEASALRQVKKANVPILFVHGEEDAFVPTDMVYQLYEACQSEKALLIVPKAGHGVAHRTDPAIYQEKLTQFIDRYISR